MRMPGIQMINPRANIRPHNTPIFRANMPKATLKRPVMRPGLSPRHFAEGGQPFNPQGIDYDYQTAGAYGMGPNGTGENAGHWGSVAPTSDDERTLHGLPEDSYVVLKGLNHPTFHKAEAAEQERGSKIVKMGDRYYSVPHMQEGGATKKFPPA